MVRIRLRRMGLKHKPAYRVVVADARAPRDGKFIETIGHYNPQSQPKILMIKQDRARYWLSVGAQPSDTVVRLLKNIGVLDGEGKATAAPVEVVEAVAPVPTKQPRSKAAAAPVAAPVEAAAAPVAAPVETAAAPVAAPVVEAAPADPVAAPVVEAAPADPAAAPVVEETSFGPGSAKALADGSAPEGYTIKGNADSMLYHVAGSRYYDSTVAEIWFDSTESAEKAGFRAPGSPKA